MEVVAAVIRDDSGRLLLAQRPSGKHLAGLWEFPGGKREPAESAHQALVRELDEELGIDVAASRPMMSLTHHYPERSIRLLIRDVSDYRGQASGREGQTIDWFSLEAARALPMPAADRPILQLLTTAPCWSVVALSLAELTVERVIRDWQSRLDAGFQSLCLLIGESEPAVFEPLVQRCADLARRAGARWLIGAPLELALQSDADGVIVDLDQLRQLRRRPAPSDRLLAVRCACSAELEQAARLEADLACLVPPRLEGDRARAIDWGALGRRIEVAPLPVLVWGAVPGALEQARALGAFGVAVTE